jgi:tRNA nucleotidyltransferase/poly(A) polymerase
MTIAPLAVPDDLREIDDVYVAGGHRSWLVGGCVRDAIMGGKPKDMDAATTAKPLEQIAMCNAAGLKWFGTGIKHGTLTVLGRTTGEPYEITTLRTDLECDGRHAEVAWTDDVEVDLGRRDLSVNAIAMTMRGEIVDPFGGVQDCLDRRIRFVGDAATRIAEDHLRILRWFRFLGRFGPDATFDDEDVRAIARNAKLLQGISVERIWSEMQRILVGEDPARVVRLMRKTGVLGVLGLREDDEDVLTRARAASSDPAFIMAAWQKDHATDRMVAWKTSRAEQDAVGFALPRFRRNYAMGNAMVDLVDGADRTAVVSLLRMRDDPSSRRALRVLDAWTVPVFPVGGDDLIAAGMKPGVEMGRALNGMKASWIASGFTLTKEQMLGSAA